MAIRLLLLENNDGTTRMLGSRPLKATVSERMWWHLSSVERPSVAATTGC